MSTAPGRQTDAGIQEPRALPDDSRLTYHLGLALIKARPYPQRLYNNAPWYSLNQHAP